MDEQTNENTSELDGLQEFYSQFTAQQIDAAVLAFLGNLEDRANRSSIFKREETEVGKWINNKTIYRRVISLANATLTDGSTLADVSSWGITSLNKYYGGISVDGIQTNFPTIIFSDSLKSPYFIYAYLDVEAEALKLGAKTIFGNEIKNLTLQGANLFIVIHYLK